MGRYFRIPWAFNGDKTTIPEDEQVDKSVSYEKGFTSNYQLPVVNSGSKIVERGKVNRILHDITSELKNIEHGVPYYITPAQNGGTPLAYGQNVWVKYTNGADTSIYRSLVANNTALPTNTTNWLKLDFGTGINRNAGRGTNQIPLIGDATIAADEASYITKSKSSVTGGYRSFSYKWSDGYIQNFIQRGGSSGSNGVFENLTFLEPFTANWAVSVMLQTPSNTTGIVRTMITATANTAITVRVFRMYGSTPQTPLNVAFTFYVTASGY